MRLSVLGLLSLMLFVFVSCSKSDSKISDYNSDEDLVLAIQKASKQIIEASELPDASQTTLINEYSDDVVDIAKLAPKLGYEVDLKCEKGERKGQYSQAYFDLNGRKLQAKKGDGKGDKGDKGDKKRCFELILPVTFTMPDDSEITIATKEDWVLLKEWHEAHPDVYEKPILQFPVDIKWFDGTVQTISDEDAMKVAKAKCDKGDKGHKKRCFRLVYPVTYTMPDGSEITIEVKEDRLLIRQWYEEHPDYQEKPSLNYPVEIKYKDGTIVIINNKEEMIEARKECGDKGDKGKRCFSLVYPVTFIMPNGDEITIETKEDRLLIKEWYTAHPDVAEKPELQYPVDIAYFDNDAVVTINNKEEMMAAKEACKDDDGDED